MNKMKIAILGPSEVAFKRFMPALKNIEQFEFVGVGVATENEKNECVGRVGTEDTTRNSMKKAQVFVDLYGGEIFGSYCEILENDEIDAIYIPLPPALHFYWAKKALENNKHVFLEKPFTTSLDCTNELIKIAKSKGLVVFENYAFIYHKQMNIVRQLIERNEIGEIRQIRTAFGFPHRGKNDFRYLKEFGGGALFDCGGYPIKLSSVLLGHSSKVIASSLSNDGISEVDIFGSVMMTNEKNVTSQISFGMDNYYKCELEVWGSKGVLVAPRIFTAPTDFSAEIIVYKEEKEVINVPNDDQFMKVIVEFKDSIVDNSLREKLYKDIVRQAEHLNETICKNSLVKGNENE